MQYLGMICGGVNKSGSKGYNPLTAHELAVLCTPAVESGIQNKIL